MNIWNEIKMVDLVLCADWDRNYGERMSARGPEGKGSPDEGAPTFVYLYIYFLPTQINCSVLNARGYVDRV